MEPFKALTFVAVAATVSLIGAGAAGFYAGYSAGRGNLNEIKAQIASAPITVSNGGSGGGSTLSLKPVLDDIGNLSKQMETISASIKAPSDNGNQNFKPILDELHALSRQVDGIRGRSSDLPSSTPVAATGSRDYSGQLETILDQVKAVYTKLDKQEPKVPKALTDEIKSLGNTIQAQEPATRRIISEEVKGLTANIQNAEPKAPKAMLDEIKNISATLKSQESRAQPSVYDQIRVVNASLEALKSKLPDSMFEDIKKIDAQVQELVDRNASSSGSQTKNDQNASAELTQLRQLVSAASDQFGKCQTQIASLTNASFSPTQQSAPSGTTTVAVTPSARQEPAAVVFYDNVMLKKDQEKQYDEIGVRLSLQAVTPKQVKLAVNRQGFGLSFGERKVFRSQDVECELNLMETNLNDSQARVSISCKR